MILVLPIRTLSESNAHAHWRTRHKRAKQQRDTLGLIVAAQARIDRVRLPVVVTVTRIAPSSGLDAHDNLRGALKHVVDGIADGLGLRSDRDPRVTWAYGQRRGPWGVEIRVEAT